MGFKDGIVREFVTQPAESNITANRYIERAVQEKVFPADFPATGVESALVGGSVA